MTKRLIMMQCLWQTKLLVLIHHKSQQFSVSFQFLRLHIINYKVPNILIIFQNDQVKKKKKYSSRKSTKEKRVLGNPYHHWHYRNHLHNPSLTKAWNQKKLPPCYLYRKKDPSSTNHVCKKFGIWIVNLDMEPLRM